MKCLHTHPSQPGETIGLMRLRPAKQADFHRNDIPELLTKFRALGHNVTMKAPHVQSQFKTQEKSKHNCQSKHIYANAKIVVANNTGKSRDSVHFCQTAKIDNDLCLSTEQFKIPFLPHMLFPMLKSPCWHMLTSHRVPRKSMIQP